MNRSSYLVRAARLAQKVPLSLFRPLEVPFVQFGNADKHPEKLIILLALPRSGSTLTYQVLVHGMGALYLSNLWNLLYALPLLGGSLSARLCGSHCSDFKSQYGFVPRMCGPAEGLKFWTYWLNNGLSEACTPDLIDEMSPKRLQYLNRVLGCLTTPSQPMICGYLGHVLLADQLLEYFPEALFVRLHRDPLSNANSIFQIRRYSQANWFSVFPKECTSIMNDSLHQQIASQVYWLNHRLDTMPENDRTIHVSYENLCRNPTAELQKIIDFSNHRGYKLQQQLNLPEAFPQRLIKNEDREHLVKIADAMRLLEKEHGTMTSGARFGYEI